MPIYEYRCQKCSHYVDVLQKISDAPLVECPECHEASLKRLISAPAFRLKGGGWYETDFKSDKEKRRNLAEGSGAANGSGKSESGSSGGESKSGTEGSGGKSGSASESSGGSSKPGAESSGGASKSGPSKSEAAV